MAWLTNPFRFGSSVPVLLPARYWRWRPLASPSAIGASDTLTATLLLALSVGGADIASGQSATASSGTASVLFDVNAASLWGANTLDLPTQWVEVDLGTSQLPAEVGIQAHTSLPELTPNVWLLQSGDTSPAINPVMIIEVPPFTVPGGEWQKVPVVQQDMTDVEANARGWRVTVNAVASGSQARAQEIEFAPTFGGATIGAQGDYAFVQLQNLGVGGSGRPKQAFDKDAGTYTQTSNLMPNYFGFIRATPVGVMEEMLFTPQVATGYWPTDITVDWTVDGINWHTKKAFPSVTGLVAGVPASFDLR